MVLDGYLKHLTNDNLHHFLLKISDIVTIGQKINSPTTKHITHRWFFRAVFSFIREYVIRGDLLGGAYGYILAMASMGYTLDKYIILWWLNNKEKP